MQSERTKMLAGELYDPLDLELVQARVRARDLCQELNAGREADQDARRRILQDLLGAGGESAWIQPPFYCDYGSNIVLGERVFFNFNCVVLDVCRVTIGDFTLFGPAVQIYTAMHPMNAELRRKQEFGKPIEIGSDVWVGGGAIICPGVRDRIALGDRRGKRRDSRHSRIGVRGRQSLPGDSTDYRVAPRACPLLSLIALAHVVQAGNRSAADFVLRSIFLEAPLQHHHQEGIPHDYRRHELSRDCGQAEGF